MWPRMSTCLKCTSCSLGPISKCLLSSADWHLHSCATKRSNSGVTHFVNQEVLPLPSKLSVTHLTLKGIMEDQQIKLQSSFFQEYQFCSVKLREVTVKFTELRLLKSDRMTASHYLRSTVIWKPLVLWAQFACTRAAYHFHREKKTERVGTR